jgi:hypothetical protein
VHATASEGGADGTTEFRTGEEHDLRSFKKMLLGAVAAMVLATGVAVSPASATVPTTGYDAVSANVPYLAWRGEHVRLGFCLPVGSEGGIPSSSNVSWVISDWSGEDFGSIPVPFEIQGARHFYNGCVYSEFASEKAGVAFIKVSVNLPADSRNPGGSQYVKQFMVAWMGLTTPAVTGGGSVYAGDIDCQEQLLNSAELLVQVLAPVRVCPATNDPLHLITARVKGIVPLAANFGEWDFAAAGVSLVSPGKLTLPDDWAAWAHVAARSTALDSGGMRDHTLAQYISNWDIHDGFLSNTEGHVPGDPGPQCDAADSLNPVGSTDTVDNCALNGQWGNDTGGFSTVLGNLSRAGSSFGPFDPLYTYDTLLSNGVLDQDDAPMPATQIDFDIVENLGTPTDISGVGYLENSWKTDTHNRTGTDTELAHNLDQPFYSQWIPATERPIDSNGSPYGEVQPTGITGAPGTAFGGFYFNGLYQNWAFAWEKSYHPNTDSHCLEYRTIPGNNLKYRPLPYNLSSVSVYTDEHGEAQVNYVPGFGYYFDNLPTVINSNPGCDLKNVDVLGTAKVNVTARYPYQPVTVADPAGTPVDFVVHSLFHKTLAAYAKGDSDSDVNMTRVVLAHAQDIDGSPLKNEIVCWNSNQLSDNAIRFYPSSPGFGSGEIKDQNGNLVTTIDYYQAVGGYLIDAFTGQKCTTTDEKGYTAIEFSESLPVTVDVTARFVNENITRDIEIDFGVQGDNGELVDTGPVSHVPSPAIIKTVANGSVGVVGPVLVDNKVVKSKVIKSTKVKKALHKIRTARVVKPFGAKRVLQVRVNGKKGMVALKITIKLGKTTHAYKRFVPANQKVNVKNLPIPAKTAKVTVSLFSL